MEADGRWSVMSEELVGEEYKEDKEYKENRDI